MGDAVTEPWGAIRDEGPLGACGIFGFAWIDRLQGAPLRFWTSLLWIAVLPLGWRILLSSRPHAVDDRYADQTDDAYSDPLLGHMQQVGA